ncbi:MAG: peptidase caspase catalytic subunit p20 [Alphaproteobacteria bacterium]|nr:peptidase caspase catalytic subunit p20 [Alphaproteobacteria bacterium]
MTRAAWLGLIVLMSAFDDAQAQSSSSANVGNLVGLQTVLDKPAVERLARQQAEAGDARAMVDYAHLMRSGSGNYEDGLRRRAESERFDRLAAERGDPLGQINTGVWCMTNQLYQTLPGACKSDVEAVRWFRLAMEQGNADGMAFYGYMVEFGRGGLAKDPDLAARYYADAGKRGSSYGREFLNDMTEFADRYPRAPNP